MIKKLLILIFFLQSNLFLLRAQVNQEWVVKYDYTGYDDFATGLAVDGSGNIFITGRSQSDTTGFDYATIKYNSSGVSQWAQRYNGPGNGADYSNAIALDGSGNIYITGGSTGINTGSDFATLKYSSSGNQLWLQRYSGSESLEPGDYAASIAVYGSGIVYVAGALYNEQSATDYATIKYNSLGSQQWIQTYNGPENFFDYVYALTIDAAGNVFVTGESYGSGQNASDYFTIKYNSSGNEMWSQRYNGPGDFIDRANAITLDNAGNVYVTGTSFGIGFNFDIVTIKYNSTGVQQWIQSFSGPGSDVASAIITDDSGNVYVTGGWNATTEGSNFITIKYSTAGVQKWIKSYNDPNNGNDFSNAIAMDSAKNIYVTGYSGSNSMPDYATIKYSSSGQLIWIERFNGSGNGEDVAVAVTLDRYNNVYITGRSKSDTSDFDYVTIKYSQTVGVNSISNELPERFSLEQNYPNPFNPNTIIRYSLIQNGLTSLRVFNSLGNEVSALVNEKQTAGTYEIEFNADKLPSGIYFYELNVNDYSETRKMILLK
ncbi:MAG: SBBP repeat-containing protein [Bacteroidota bacterium]|nr:SBBP repeat-containing protein [Bacteroidota bacterium]